MLKQDEITSIDSILAEHDYNANQVITIMQEVQHIYHYLPQEVLTYIAGKIGISEAKIYGVATFYENFSLVPKGKYVIKVCDGTACHVRKSIPILEEFRELLGVTKEMPTTADMKFTVETVSCLGACGLAPVCTVNDEVHPSMTKEKVWELVEQLRREDAE